METVLKMTSITKRFEGVLANDKVNLTVGQGEIHGLIGENGAGKSTLMNILYGLVQKDSGTIELEGKEIEIPDPQTAIRYGIGMVHQHFMLVPGFSVLQNIILGSEPGRAGFIDYGEARKRVLEIMQNYALNLDLDRKVMHLSVGQMQIAEILKLLYRGAKIIVLDEPTAVLAPAEIQDLFKILKRLAGQGCSVIFITHKLREVIQITTNITIMRKGVVTGNVRTSETNADELSTMMIGRKMKEQLERITISNPRTVFAAENVRVCDSRGFTAVKDITFGVKQGEILGVAGIEGNGQDELTEALVGLQRAESGKFILNGQEITGMSIRKRRERGLSHIPADRLKRGVVASCSIWENLMTTQYYKPSFSRMGVMKLRRCSEQARELIDQYVIKVPDENFAVSTLSGGNMQKVVIARELNISPDFLIAAQPTRGVDIGAIAFIYDRLIEMRNSGRAILLISSELDEILKLSDRIMVMYEGEIVVEFLNDGNLSEIELGLYMTGSKRREVKGNAQ